MEFISDAAGETPESPEPHNSAAESERLNSNNNGDESSVYRDPSGEGAEDVPLGKTEIVTGPGTGPSIETPPEEIQGTADVVPGDTAWSIQEGMLIGDPVGDSRYWFQQAQNGFCLPASIAQIVSEYTGVIFENEMAFVDIANQIGAFTVGYDGIPGIPFEKGVEILNKAGVPAEYGFGDLQTLATGLDSGYNIIVFVDSGEIWTGEAAEDNLPDHAVVITGIDADRGTVLLSDPGSPDGNLSELPIDTFMNSWADSQNAMIICDKVPESGQLDPSFPQQPLEETSSRAVHSPWMLLPVTLSAAKLNPL